MTMTSPNARRPCVLVADDEATNVLVITHALKPDFDVIQASSGDEALARVAAGGIDLLLLDVMMPGLDGFEVCRRLKAEPETAAIPIIFVTALEDSAEETLGFEIGAVDYITKPIRPAIVRARVRTHVELKRSRDMLEHLALIDPLTGVSNRRHFGSVLDAEWRRAYRAKSWLSLALIDVDLFKQFNDRYGHLAGDDRLRAIAGALSQTFRRAGDMIARYGGEEFAVVLPGLGPDTMPVILRDLLTAAANAEGAVAIDDSARPTISIGGISVVPSNDVTVQSMIATADDLLYEAKKGGRDRAVHRNGTTGETVVVRRPGAPGV